ncbi:MAG: rpmC [Gammaproteobacteria bacterium]|jgi:large subunit ribosomal protein L29|nr:rpmC [Gammaproteobacteria bacterium]
MNVTELRAKSIEELQSVELLALLKEHLSLRIQKGTGQTPPTHLFKKVKREIARVKTIIREKEGSKL